MSLPECPAGLKALQPYLKTATEHDSRDVVIGYWCRLYALQMGLKALKQQPEERIFLIHLMDWLESHKKTHHDNESITNETVGSAHLENYALKLFLYADNLDRAGNFGKNVVKAFYTAGMIYDVMATFGEPSEEVMKNGKYAKYKAAYIHNCLKNGETPIAGPMTNDENDDELGAVGGAPGPSSPQPPTAGFYLPPTKYTPDPSQLPPANFTPTDPFKHMRAPSPPKEPEKQPGGFVPYYAPEQPSHPQQDQKPTTLGHTYGNVHLTADQLIKAAKYAKWAGSALTYEDVQTAVNNLKFALQLLETGHDPNGP